MASMKHEGLLTLFRNRPTLAAELLQDALGLELPAWSEARVESAEFTQVVPTEYRADLVVLLLDGKPILAIVVEVQLSRDEDKRKSWPLYLTSLRSRVGCPAVLMDRPWRPKYQKKRVPQRTLILSVLRGVSHPALPPWQSPLFPRIPPHTGGLDMRGGPGRHRGETARSQRHNVPPRKSPPKIARRRAWRYVARSGR
jgi:hypothetical protein